jgi:hypothetical protein
MIDYDCQACGACCALFTVLVFTDELDIVPEGLYELRSEKNRFKPTSSGRRAMHVMAGTGGEVSALNRETSNRCSAFEGEVGKPCSCSIYSTGRPHQCREFVPGSSLCEFARDFYKLGKYKDNPTELLILRHQHGTEHGESR